MCVLAILSTLHTELSLLQSLSMGRPPAIRPSYIDCELPTDEEPTFDEQGNPQVGCKDVFPPFNDA